VPEVLFQPTFIGKDTESAKKSTDTSNNSASFTVADGTTSSGPYDYSVTIIGSGASADAADGVGDDPDLTTIVLAPASDAANGGGVVIHDDILISSAVAADAAGDNNNSGIWVFTRDAPPPDASENDYTENTSDGGVTPIEVVYYGSGSISNTTVSADGLVVVDPFEEVEFRFDFDNDGDDDLILVVDNNNPENSIIIDIGDLLPVGDPGTDTSAGTTSFNEWHEDTGNDTSDLPLISDAGTTGVVDDFIF
jgi:hypothetical protein